MSQLTGYPTLINTSGNTNLSASIAAGGYVIAGPNFSGYTLSLYNGFASDFYTAIGSKPLYWAQPGLFSCGNGNSFILVNNDPDIITSNSTTFYNNGRITDSWHPTILFIVTQTSPPQFKLVG